MTKNNLLLRFLICAVLLFNPLALRSEQGEGAGLNPSLTPNPKGLRVTTNHLSAAPDEPVVKRSGPWRWLFGEPATKVIPAPKPPALSTARHRFTERALAGDQKFYSSLSERLTALEKRDGATNLYLRSKAGAWVFVSREQYALDDRSGFIEAAANEATNIIHFLERADGSDYKTNYQERAPRARLDLWKLTETALRHEKFQEVQAQTASLEVLLVLIGHVQNKRGWRASIPYIEEAESLSLLIRGALVLEPPAFTPGENSGHHKAKNEKGRLKALESRLKSINERGVPVSSYHWAKALAWLDFAEAQRAANDRSGIVSDATEQAEMIIDQMEKAAPDISLATSELRGRRVRADLWNSADAFKSNAKFNEIGSLVAQMEIYLVWGGYERRSMGWRSAAPFIARAEELNKYIEVRLQQLAAEER